MSSSNLLNRLRRAVQRRVAPAPVVRLVQQEQRLLDKQLLLGRSALVTGGGRNIGRSIAREMARQGANVYFTDVNATAIAELERELEAAGTRVRGFLSDIAKPADIESLCGALDAAGVLVDLLANNVGITRGEGLLTHSIDEMRALFETNVFGPLQLTQHVAKALVAAGRPGSILFVTSIHAQTTSGRLAYSASKAAVSMIVRELALELAPHRIRVNGIAPGAVSATAQDELALFAGAPLFGSHIHPSYIGRAAVYLCSDYFSQFTTGSVVTIDAGLLTRRQDR